MCRKPRHASAWPLHAHLVPHTAFHTPPYAQEPNPYDVGIVLGQSLGDALNHPKEWAAYLEPYEQQGGKKRRT